MSPTRLLLIALTAALALAAPASARTYDIPKTLGIELTSVANQTDVPVRVPQSLALDYDGDVYATGDPSSRRYTIDLEAVADCGGANACFLGQLSGERGGRPAFRRRARLARGITGYYKPLTCGGSCSPPMIQWRQGGVLYAIQAKVGRRGARNQRREMIRAANSAIRGRAR